MRQRMKRVLAGAAVAGLLVVGGGTAASAGTTYTSYNTTVGAFNGSGYTAYQTKAITGATGYVRSVSVGGDYQVDARMDGPGTDGPWVRVGDNQTKALNNDFGSGAAVRTQFSNDLTTRVAVQVTGSWASN